MVATPSSAADITPEWLAAAAPELSGVASVKAERLGEGVGMMTELHRLKLNYKEGCSGPKTLVVKQPAALEALRDVANAYGLYEREVLFYQEIAQTVSVRSPHCYVAAFDPETFAFALVMEDLAGATLGDQVAGLTPQQIKVAVDQVGDLHARWWGRPELKGLASKGVQAFGTPPYADFSARHGSGWETFDAWIAGRVSNAFRDAGARMCTELDRITEDMASEPRTICHGDFRADNMMFTGEGAQTALTCVDWQLAMQARGPFDIGYMMSGSVNTDVRREYEMPLLKGYHDKLVASGVENYSFDECLHDYRRALLIGLTYMSQSGAAADLSEPRTEALYETTCKRIDAAIQDHGLAEFLS